MQTITHDFDGLDNIHVFSTGPVPCRVFFIGSTPGQEEAETGRSFCGRVGQELDRFYLPLAGLRRRDIRIGNLVPVHPLVKREPTKDEIKFFEPFILRDLEQTNPELIVPMGALATNYFLPGRDLHQIQGLAHKTSRWPGKTILPIPHPAFGLQSSDSQPQIVYGLQQVALWLEGKLGDRPANLFPNPIYIELFTAEDVEQALEGTICTLMGMDTEGYKGNPWGLSFSTGMGVAYVIRVASADALKAFGRWLKRNPQCLVILHNALHDLPILREMGIDVPQFEDTMVYAYALCLEPQGLKDLAYRHCGMKMKSYEDVTGPAMRKLTAEYLLKVAAGDWGFDPKVPVLESDKEIRYSQPQALHKRALKAVNDIYGLYTGTIVGEKRGGSAKLKELGVRVGKVDNELAAEWNLPKGWTAWHAEVPLPIQPKLDALYGDFIFDLTPPVKPEDPPDACKRWESMAEDLEESVARAEAVLGSLPETGLDAIEDQQIAVDYSACDALATIENRHKLYAKVKASGLLKVTEMDMATLPYLDRMRTIGLKVNKNHMSDYGDQLAIEMRLIQEKLERDLGIWCNPSSSQQVGMIIYDMLGFPVEVRTSTGLPSTNDKILEALAPLHANIADITDFRELHKLRYTYALKLGRWTDARDRVHPNYKYTRVASGRLALSDPNLLGIPTRSDRGRKIRAGFVPEDGNVYISCDLSQIEVRVAAHFSKDPNLIKIFMEKGHDFHTRTAASMWHISEEEILADDEKNGGASMRSSAKNVSFGVLYGISAKGLQAQLKSKCHTDWSEGQCEEMIAKWLDIAYPRVREYMEAQKSFCRQKGYVESMHGRRRYLPGVNSTIGRLREEAHRAAINHPIQSTAAEILKIAQIKVWNDVLPLFWSAGVRVEPVLAIHDEILLECEFSAADEVKAAVIYAMESAVELIVPIVSKGKISRTGSLGGSWGDLK